MGDFYDDLLKNYEEAEESHGFSGDPLPTGWYALTVEKVLETTLSRKGSPQARLQLLVNEGDAKDQRAFVSVTLGAASQNSDGSMRSKDELDSTNKNILGQMKGLMKALGVQTGTPAGEFPEKVFNFFNVSGWQGRQFVGKINLQPGSGQWGPSNRLNAYHSYDDPKKGIAWLRGQASNEAPQSAPQTV